MPRSLWSAAPGLVVAAFTFAIAVAAAESENWPGWRGPRGDGTSLEANVPTQWDGAGGQNIAWKAPIPGTGHSSPIVWEDRVFVVSCLSDTQERVLISLDRKTGKTLWQTTVLKAALENKHNLNSHASGTPATDGKLVYVTFLEIDGTSDVGGRRTPGEMVVAAYDFDGHQKWQVKPGRFASVHGYCSCPVIFEDKLIVNGDHDGDGYIVALDRQTGKEIWKITRPNNTRSYVTPIIRDIAGRTQMILTGSKCTASYDPRTGKELWYMDGPTEQFVASPVYDGKYVYLTAGFPEYHILAVDPNHSGRVSDEVIQWRTTKGCSYVPSPVLCGEYFLVVSDNGIGSCYHAQSGELLWMERLGRHYSASLVTAGGLVYCLDDDGVMKVVRPGEKLEVVAISKLGEYCYASPAISQGQIFIRTDKSLFCIGGK
ncbi:MAG TPA: PQQ-binding-like beta-propeller repeat protein [Pirellulaceae bacterium]|nr:PQQ-binding-like beta-propeller repeat protein [Pirellulaceae bacterium]